MVTLDEKGGATARRWGMGLTVALALHGALIAPFYLMPRSAPAEPLGDVMVIDMSQMTASPLTVNQDPAAEEIPPTEEPPEESVPEEVPPENPPLEEVVPEEVVDMRPPEPVPQPNVEPQPEPQPEAEVSPPEPKREPPPPPPAVKPKAPPPEDQRPVKKTVEKPKPVGRLSFDAPEAETLASKPLGADVPPSPQRIASWGSEVKAALLRVKSYPQSARRRGQEGSPRVQFSLDGQGKVLAVDLVRSSGVDVLDQEAVKMVWRVVRFPPHPSGKPITVIVPIDFDLKSIRR
ncbi:TonB family protein [Rhodospirillum sp. A1_3_36]|uniref:energy transducer TonB n=1 Tax=Rhodospirillum sp. A1_3_36 TaxID=3391666 RepID=UPI0039A5C309